MCSKVFTGRKASAPYEVRYISPIPGAASRGWAITGPDGRGSVSIARVLPLDAADQDRMRAAAYVAETAAGAGEAAECVERGRVVRPVRIGEVDALVRIVEIPANLKLHPLLELPGLGEGRLRPD